MNNLTIQIDIHDLDDVKKFIKSKKALINTIKHAVGNTPDKSIRGSLEMLERLEFAPEHIKFD